MKEYNKWVLENVLSYFVIKVLIQQHDCSGKYIVTPSGMTDTSNAMPLPKKGNAVCRNKQPCLKVISNWVENSDVEKGLIEWVRDRVWPTLVRTADWKEST